MVLPNRWTGIRFLLCHARCATTVSRRLRLVARTVDIRSNPIRAREEAADVCWRVPMTEIGGRRHVGA